MDWLAWNRARYNTYAPIYDWFVGRVGFIERGRRRAIELAAIRPGERVLIIAAGTGLDLPWLPPESDVTAIDISPAMLARFTTRAAALRRQVRAEVMDAARLDFPAVSFDCVLLHLAIAVVPDPLATMREVARVLRPGGRVSVFDKFLPNGSTASPLRRAAGAVARLVATDLNRQLGPLLEAGGLQLRTREPAVMASFFIAARADKPRAS